MKTITIKDKETARIRTKQKLGSTFYFLMGNKTPITIEDFNMLERVKKAEQIRTEQKEQKVGSIFCFLIGTVCIGLGALNIITYWGLNGMIIGFLFIGLSVFSYTLSFLQATEENKVKTCQ